MTRPRSVLRVLAAVCAMLAVLGTLSACRVNSGSAAFVGDQRIAEADVAKYIDGQTAATGADAPQQSPRNFVLGVLVVEQLWEDYLRSAKALPTDTQLAASRETALASQGASAPTDAQLRAALPKIGVDASFAPVYTRQAELGYFVNQKATAEGVTSQEQFSKLINDAVPTVKLSPRYGKWNPSSLTIEGETPAYLQLSSSAAAAPPA